MRSLPFKKVAQIEQLSTGLPLEELALVLTTGEQEGGILVYLEEQGSLSLPDGWQVKRLATLQDDDFLTWDGLAVGYDPLQLYFPLLLTQGPNFYAIRHLFAALDRLDIYRENARHLAQWLYQTLQGKETSRRFQEKVFELLAPAWLEISPPAGSVGLALSSSDLPSYLSGQAAPQWLAISDLEKGSCPADFLLTFDEIKLAYPHLKEESVNLLEWRPILWKNEKQDLLVESLAKLALIFWKKGEKQKNAALGDQAYALALERWLAQADTEHLVAVFPDADFYKFLETGNAIFVKQMPRIFIGEEHHPQYFTLKDLLNENPELHKTIKTTYRGTPFCVEPLAQKVSSFTRSEALPLEKVLAAVDKAPSLAATFLSLVNDFIKYDDMKVAQITTEQIRDVALKGTYFLALSDPWNKAWRGRFNLLLDQAYTILDDALLLDEKARQSRSSHLSRAWYGCYREQNLSHRWNELQELAHEFTGKNRENQIPEQELPILQVLTGQGINISSNTIGKQVRDLQYSPSWQKEAPTLTHEFLEQYDEWHKTHQLWRTIEHDLVYTPPSAEQIETLLNTYRRIQHCLYALPHEMAVIHYLCQQDTRSLMRLQSALRQEVSLKVQLLTSSAMLGEPSPLIFEVQNIGEKDAGGLRFILEPSPQYEVVDEKKQYIADLAAHTGGLRLNWRIRVREAAPVMIHLKYALSGISGGESESYEFSLSVIHQTGKGRGPSGGNPFQAGVAVDSEKFFGRQKELKSVFDLLLHRTNQPILLRGPRRIGKTSILQQIKYLLVHEGELQRHLGYTREEEVEIRLIRPIFTTLQGIQNDKDIAGWYFDLFLKILGVAGFSPEPQPGRADFDTDSHFVFVRQIQRLLDDHPEVRLVILIDEWDEQRHLSALGGKLRALMQNEKRLNWVIASTWMLSAESGRFGSPFYGQTKATELKEMSWEDAQAMVGTLSERVGVMWQSEAQVTLLDQTALRPYLIQTLGQRIIIHLTSARPPFNLVDMETVKTVISDFIRGTRSQGSHFAFLWEEGTPEAGVSEPQARLSWLGRLILWTLEQNFPQTMKLIEIRNFLRAKLEERGWEFPMPECFEDDLVENLSQLELIFDVIMKAGERYTFSIPLAQAWFHNAVSQYDDPLQFAFERLKREYRKPGRANKEQS